MRGVYLFVLVQVVAVIMASFVSTQPYVDEFRPDVISEEPSEGDIFNILLYVLVGTVVLLAIRFLGFKLKYFLDLTVFVSCYYLGAIVSNNGVVALLSGALGAIGRQAGSVFVYNLVSGATVVAFCLIFGLFLDPFLVALLLGLMSLYDVIGVFYTKHIKYIWFGQVGFNPLWRNTLAFILPQEDSSRPFSIIGAGDFALPTVLTVSATLQNPLAGVVLLLFTSLGFYALESYAAICAKTKETGVPGIPILAFFSIVGLILSQSLGLMA